VTRVWVDPGLLSQVIGKLDAAIGPVPVWADRLYHSLDRSLLSVSRLGVWRGGGANVWQLMGVRQRCRDVLAKALALEKAGVPGFHAVVMSGGQWGLVPGVEFDDDPGVGLGDAQAAADLLGQIGDLDASADPSAKAAVAGLLPRLESLLAAGAGDTAFCVQLSQLVSPSAMVLALDQIDIVVGGAPAGHAGTDDSARYARLLAGLGTVYSTASGAMAQGGAQWSKLAQGWEDVFAGARPGSPAPQLAALVVSRGRWSDGFLDAVAGAITAAEGSQGTAHWQLDWLSAGGRPRQIVDPGMSMPDGSPVVVGDPMYGVFMGAALGDPGWLARWCHDAGSVQVSWDLGGVAGTGSGSAGEVSGQVNRRLYDLVTSRGLDASSFLALQLAASAADVATQPVSVPDGWVPPLSTGLVRLAGMLERDQRLYEAKPWWDKYGKQVMEDVMLLASAVAVLATGGLSVVAAGVATGMVGADAVWDVTHGDVTGALVDVACLVLPVVVGAAIHYLPVSRSVLDVLRAGGSVAVDGEVVSLDESSMLVVNGGGKAAPAGRGAVGAAGPGVEDAEPVPVKPFAPDIADHIRNVQWLNRKGVGGGHNLDAFNQAYLDYGVDPADAIVSGTELYPGIYEVEYRTPLLTSQMTPVEPRKWTEQAVSKTLYDPSRVSDAEYLEWAREAMSNARLVPGRNNVYEGIADNGLKFRGIVRNGKFETVYATR